MHIRHRRLPLRLRALALAAFAFAAAFAAVAGTPQCAQCLDEYYACRYAGGDYSSCFGPFWDCERANGCPLSLPPEV